MKKEEGIFIVIEGTDGSGKRTQQYLLRDRIQRETGLSVTLFDFPQYETSAFGAEVGMMMRGDYGDLQSVDPRFIALPYILDRCEASPTIRKALTQGKVALSNRYALSNLAFQGARVEDSQRGELIHWMMKMEYGVMRNPREDLNILLRVPPKIGQELVVKKGARGYVGNIVQLDENERNLSYQDKVYEVYMELARRNPKTIKVVECCDLDGQLQKEGAIHERVWEVVGPYITENIRGRRSSKR